MVSGARRATNRVRNAWRRKQTDFSSAVELFRAAGRFLQLESGWTTAVAGMSCGVHRVLGHALVEFGACVS